MKWIEVIQLRAVDGNREFLESKLNTLINEVVAGSKEQTISAYHRALIDSDYSIHIFHRSNPVENFGSPLGERIVSALREFGLVNHTVWIGINNS